MVYFSKTMSRDAFQIDTWGHPREVEAAEPLGS